MDAEERRLAALAFFEFLQPFLVGGLLTLVLAVACVIWGPAGIAPLVVWGGVITLGLLVCAIWFFGVRAGMRAVALIGGISLIGLAALLMILPMWFGQVRECGSLLAPDFGAKNVRGEFINPDLAERCDANWQEYMKFVLLLALVGLVSLTVGIAYKKLRDLIERS